MTIARKQESLILLLGDILFFLVALWLTLTIRYVEIPDTTLIYNHLVPFSFLFVAWIGVYFISGLYGKQTTLLRSRLLSIILRAQIVNISIAATFFFLIPYFGITPKTNLFIYLIVSSGLVVFWRMHAFSFFETKKKQKAVLIGYHDEVQDLVEEVNRNPRYHIEFTLVAEIDESLDEKRLQAEIFQIVESGEASVIVADVKSRNTRRLLPALYQLSFFEEKVAFFDIHKVYESVFDRIPLSALNESWILENISLSPKPLYDAFKRITDIVLAVPALAGSLLIFPFIYLAIKLDDGGGIFFAQERIGKNNKPIRITKFRTMSGGEEEDKTLNSKRIVTRVGRFLRVSRIDELPQLWNVIRGDLSLIGPRPEITTLVEHYKKEIPFYSIRHIITPGLTGWAQTCHENHPHHSANTVETRVKLSHDLFYLKERSILLDTYIGFRTIKTLLSRVGK